MLADEYNSLYIVKEDRVKKAKDEMKVTVLVDNVELVVNSTRRQKLLSLLCQSVNFTYNFNPEVMEYLVAVHSLTVLAEQHRRLAIIKLDQTSVRATTQRVQKTMSIAVATRDANVKLFVPMYFEILEEVCECLAWVKVHRDDVARPQRPIEEFYKGNVPKYVSAAFKVLELAGDKVSVHILFNENLIYNIKLENVVNDQEFANVTPIVCAGHNW